MSRILLLLDQHDNRDLLAEWLAAHYEVVLSGSEQELDGPFDICIMDAPALARLEDQVRARKAAEQPIFLPMLLVASRHDIRAAPHDRLQSVDELLVSPIERVELQARVKALLHTRQLAVDLQRSREESFRSLVEGVKDYAIFMLDSAGAVVSWNAGMEVIVGYRMDEIVGKHISCLYSVEDLQKGACEQELARAAAEGHAEDEGWRVRKDGSLFWADGVTTALRSADGQLRGFLKLVRDITVRKQLETQLLQAQKMEMVGRLAGGVAHDFNNLLTAIAGYAELAHDALPDAHPVRGDLVEIQKAADRATKLTRQLLAFARRQVIEARVLNLNELIGEMDKLIRRLLPASIELVTLPNASLGLVKADPNQIEQVLVNLVVNARDAMPNGGTLLIEMDNVVFDEEYAHQNVGVAAGEYVMLAISDTGTGMTEQIKQKIFEPFFTTKPEGRGTGLGLATCDGIIRQHNGYIWVYSEVGHGTSVKIHLPRVEDSGERLTPGRAAADLPRGAETVLLVEDEPTVRLVCARMLRAQGYSVLEAINGEDALQVAQQHAGAPIDLLVTDVVMPRMSGMVLADRLMARRRGLRVLFMSGYTDAAVVQHGLLEVDAAFLQKPFSTEALARKVRAVLDARAIYRHSRTYGS